MLLDLFGKKKDFTFNSGNSEVVGSNCPQSPAEASRSEFNRVEKRKLVKGGRSCH